MICSKCNNEIKQNEMFCGKCGTKVTIQNSKIEFNNSNVSQLNRNPQFIGEQQPGVQNSQFVNRQQSQPSVQNPQFVEGQNSQSNSNIINEQQYLNNYNNVNQIQQKKNWKNTTALVIGIISLVSVFIFQVFTIPLSIVGILFSALSLKENKKHKIGLILNIISLVLAIPVFMLYASILESRPANPTIGTWDCKAFNNGYNEDLDYIITMKLNNDNQFKWNKYNDEKNNYVIGTYNFVDLHKTNNNGTANYYSITLTGDEFVNDGVLQTEPYKSKYEMGIIKDSNEAILMNVYTYNIYYCYRNDTSSPKVDAKHSGN